MIPSHVFINSVRTKVPMEIIGESKASICFLISQPPVLYFSQNNAWSDEPKYRLWGFDVFISFIWRTHQNMLRFWCITAVKMVKTCRTRGNIYLFSPCRKNLLQCTKLCIWGWSQVGRSATGVLFCAKFFVMLSSDTKKRWFCSPSSINEGNFRRMWSTHIKRF